MLCLSLGGAVSLIGFLGRFGNQTSLESQTLCRWGRWFLGCCFFDHWSCPLGGGCPPLLPPSVVVRLHPLLWWWFALTLLWRRFTLASPGWASPSSPQAGGSPPPPFPVGSQTPSPPSVAVRPPPLQRSPRPAFGCGGGSGVGGGGKCRGVRSFHFVNFFQKNPPTKKLKTKS